MKRFPVKRLVQDAPFLLGFSVMCAVVIILITGKTWQFHFTLAFSMSIGTVTFLLVDGLRLWMWGGEGQRTNWRVFLPLVVLVAPLAHVAGSEIARLIIGLPADDVDPLLSPRWWDSVLFTLLAAIGGMLLVAGRERLARAQADAALERERAERVERQAVQAQLQLLRAQLEPHMLFNTLANVQGLIAIDPPRAQQMLDQLIQYLRATLCSSRGAQTTLAHEFALLEAYLGLMAVRMGRRLAYGVELPEELRDLPVPPMLLQPLVENAIAHGLEPKVEGGRIHVSGRREDDAIVLTVADDGRGPGAGAGKPGTGLGLSNTRERLKALYGERARLTLAPGVPSGAIATLHLPMP